MLLEIDGKLTLDADTIASPNLCSKFSEEDLESLGLWAKAGYDQDYASCDKWRERNAAGLDLAMQIIKAKDFPWPECSNVAFPLTTIGVLQFHARAYPAIINGTEVVKMRVVGNDPDKKESDRARRVSTHMSWQCLEEDASWEEQHQKLIINLACVGTNYKKTYLKNGINTGDFVQAKDLVLNYWAKSVDDCPRKTHVIPMFRNDIYSRVKRGQFRDILQESWYTELDTNSQLVTDRTDQDDRHGLNPPMSDEASPFSIHEQHVDIDLDKDGYAEPYILTYEESSGCVLRLVTRFDRLGDIELNKAGDIVRINAREYFTKYGFIPSIDGGILDIGFGVLLGPLNEACNNLINQLVDSGTMKNTAGGFLGRGAKFKSGKYQFDPFTWHRMDSSGDDIRKNVFPLPVNDPSSLTFQLLGFIVNYASRIPGNTDIMVGENPGQNTPAETSRNMTQQGMAVYSAIFKGIWRSMKDEFKKRYLLNAIAIPIGRKISYGNGIDVSQQDYLGDPTKIVPAADPHITSEGAEVQKAMLLKQAAATTQGYDQQVVERLYLRAMKIDNIDQVYPGPGKVQPLTNPKVQIEQMKTQVKMEDLKLKKQQFVLDMMEQSKLNKANIIKLTAEAQKIISEVGVGKSEMQIKALEAAGESMKNQDAGLMQRIELMMKEIDTDGQGQGEPKGDTRGAGMEGMAGAPADAAIPQGASSSPGQPA